MKLNVIVYVSGVVCWDYSQIIGTFVSKGTGCQDASHVYFGQKDVFIKRYCQAGVRDQLYFGRWYRSGNSRMLQGLPGKEDEEMPFNYTDTDHIRYGNSELSRTSEPTPLDTLAMVGFGCYVSTLR